MTASEPPTIEPPQLKPPLRRSAPAFSPRAAIALYLIFVFVGAALISPRLYASAQFLETISHRFSFLANQPFDHYVNRCLILLAILGLPSLFKALRLRPAVLGLNWSGRHGAEAVQGFAWAFVSLGLVAALLVTCEARALDFNHDSARWMRHLKNAGLAALVVGLLEELLFRSALFGSLRQSQSFWPAALCSSALYALFHFLDRPENPPYVEWTSGFAVLGQMLQGFTAWQTMIPGFLNLTLLGCLFALVFERTGSILFSIGLHSGFVFWMKSFGFLSNPTAGAATWFWGTEKLIDGWAAGLVLVLVFLLIERTLPPRKAVPA